MKNTEVPGVARRYLLRIIFSKISIKLYNDTMCVLGKENLDKNPICITKSHI